ncbi:MAG TPA: Hsp20/alpha crystallin family protein [Acidimicrobiales bacterium]|nr:Hsp20/alpha crystallin family protein [Acidimicrobiales bacterium]
MLTRFEPFADFDRFSSELLGALSRRTTSMPIDAYRHGDHWVVKVDLPGVNPDQVDLTVDRNVLRIEAKRDWRPEEGDLVLAAERPRGTFSRQLVLSEDIETGAIQADYRDGVLTVLLPVAEAAKPKKVAINAPGGSRQAVQAQAVQAQAVPSQAVPSQAVEQNQAA